VQDLHGLEEEQKGVNTSGIPRILVFPHRRGAGPCRPESEQHIRVATLPKPG